jgi:hypothetical protein
VASASPSPSSSGQGQQLQSGVQGASIGGTMPNTGIQIWPAILGLIALAVGLRLVWISRAPRRL